jgi:hypothetical protein
VIIAVFDIGRIKRRLLHARKREVIVVGSHDSPALSFAVDGDQ